MSSHEKDLDQTSINTIRTLAMDAIQQANSGHPGAPMGMAPVAYTLWQRVLRFDPDQPLWPNRDRFVLSAGHASGLMYGLLHLAGVKKLDDKGAGTDAPAITLDNIKSFRQLGSPCAGHPEYGEAAGIETTTGPLGQGLSNAVGMAIASRWLGAQFNEPDFPLFDHDVYAMSGDGCLQEGISYEAASFAGHLGLSNLCWIWDNNEITIEGPTDLTWREDVPKRFEAAGWMVTRVKDGNDIEALEAALKAFKAETKRPTLIVVDTHIAFGSPNKQDKSAAHGAPLGVDEIRLTKENYGWPVDSSFLVPEGVPEHFAAGVGARGKAAHSAWHTLFDGYQTAHADKAAQLALLLKGELPAGLAEKLPTFEPGEKKVATRGASGTTLNALAPSIPWLIGGSADLAPSNKTWQTAEGVGVLGPDVPGGRNIHFGVREHAMGAIANGMALSGLRPYVGTFLIFSDYMRPAIRLSAMMKQPVIYVYTHDSIAVGEDGPTHQPVEQLPSLRAMPNCVEIRASDAAEVAQAWQIALERTDGPTLLVLSRQGLPVLDRTKVNAPDISRGAYVVRDPTDGDAEIILIGSGGEVALCLEAADELATEGIRARVVALASWTLFSQAGDAYQDEVLPPAIGPRVAVEQTATFGWERWVGRKGAVIGMTGFGSSAPYDSLVQHFGFTADKVVAAAKAQLGK